MPCLFELVYQSHIMRPHSFVHILSKYLTDAALESFSLISDSRVRLTTDIDDLVERAFSDFLRREATPFSGHHHNTTDVACCEIEHITPLDSELARCDTYPDDFCLRQAA